MRDKDIPGDATAVELIHSEMHTYLSKRLREIHGSCQRHPGGGSHATSWREMVKFHREGKVGESVSFCYCFDNKYVLGAAYNVYLCPVRESQFSSRN